MNLKKLKSSILEISGRHDYCVNIYAWSASSLRKLTRRMEKDGDLVCVLKTKTHRHYRKTQQKESP